MDNYISSALQNSPHIVAILEAAENLLESIDLSPILVNIIDTTPAEALPYLAGQFDMLGYNGWIFADTWAKQRALLKRAIELHRRKGTPWSIVEALKIAGYSGASFIEGIETIVTFNGLVKYDGARTFDPNGFFWDWARFSAIVELGPGQSDTPEQKADARAIIEAYAPARCELVEITFI